MHQGSDINPSKSTSSLYWMIKWNGLSIFKNKGGIWGMNEVTPIIIPKKKKNYK